MSLWIIIISSWVCSGLQIYDMYRSRKPPPLQEVTGDIIGWRGFAVHRMIHVDLDSRKKGRPDMYSTYTTCQLVSPISPAAHTFDLLGQNVIGKYQSKPTEDGATTGFYVFRRKSSCLRYFKDHLGIGEIVLGTVLCHGHVMHHTRDGWFDNDPEGFRCQHVEILSLYSRSTNVARREELSRELGWVEGIKHTSEGQEVFPLNLKEKEDG